MGNKMKSVPFFFLNKDWYYYDKKEGIYKLTDKAPEVARKSYEKYYQEEDDQ